MRVDKSTYIKIELSRNEAVDLFNALHQFADAFNSSDLYDLARELAEEIEPHL